MRRPRLLLASALAILAAPSAPAGAQATPPRPAPVFAPCAGCHSIEPGKTMFGPSLHRVAGRKAASLAGYPYSAALKASGLTWNAATLDRWLRGPQKLVPGTRMPFGGIADPATRKAVVDYLLTVK
ncbi:cytochrome C [Chakrabartia godavariana]|nr:cytochrome C [Chakrabartia godavariana]